MQARWVRRLHQLSSPGSFNSVRVNLAQAHWLNPSPTEEFRERLKHSMEHWRSDRKSAVWLMVPPALSWTVHPAIECGFQLHHVKDNILHLLGWLESSPCRVPPYATHQIGVAGFVLDADLNLLVIKEKNSRLASFKLPGGLSDPGEDISAAAVREVFEETGIETRFKSLLSFRQQHGVAFGISDLYMICRCEPLTTEIRACPTEIAEAKWMPLQEYVQQASHLNGTIAQMVLDAATSKSSFHPGEALSCDISQTTMESAVYKGKTFHLYLPNNAVAATEKL
eukprot:m.112351 g.112351  ORF g.112351 m.112351 type:complete len:282 (-) comp15323_c1_seq1:340-1185(-)